MISLSDTWHVVAATIPLYFAMIIAYLSVKWWTLFTAEQCAGINKFVAKFSIPMLSFQVISSTNLYEINMKLVYSDLLQKAAALMAMVAVGMFKKEVSVSWVLTAFSLTTLPNTLIVGIPLLKAMYGPQAQALLSQIVVLQSVLWYNLLLFLLEVHATRRTLSTAEDEQSKETEANGEIRRACGRESFIKTLQTVAKKLAINPNFYATLAGVVWAIVHFREGATLPDVVDKSITILASGGLGMAMFSIGLFMASQQSVVACGAKLTVIALGLKFVVGPGIMALSSFATGLQNDAFRIAVVQAALPQGIVPFVFAHQYNVHPEILSTGFIFSMIIALPVGLAYYCVLAS